MSEFGPSPWNRAKDAVPAAFLGEAARALADLRERVGT